MKSINIIAVLLVLFSSCGAQIKNAETKIVTIYGNCGMCENTIEKAGNKKRVASVDWNKETKKATVTYNAKKNNLDEVLQRIALAGYDSENFRAPDNVYNNLHGCCQYERPIKSAMIKKEKDKSNNDHSMHDHGSKEPNKMEGMSNVNTPTKNHNHNETMARPMETDTIEHIGIKEVFSNYFLLKDAFVAGNQNDILNYSGALYRTCKKVDMKSLYNKVHMLWMKKMKALESDASKIANEKDIAKQRKTFIELSKNMYDLAKVANQENPIYYQHCPMANNGKGANWLSLQKEVNNPYYGAQMLHCGSIEETIK